MVFAHADIFAGVVNGAALAYYDVACFCVLSTEELDTQTFTFRFTAVFRTTNTFLVCHFSNCFKLTYNFFNDYLCKILAMAVLNLIAFSSLLLEDDNLVVFKVTKNFCFNLSTFNNRCAHFNLTVVIHKQDFIEAQRRTFVVFKTVNIELTIFFNFKLLTCNFYDCVHLIGFVIVLQTAKIEIIFIFQKFYPFLFSLKRMFVPGGSCVGRCSGRCRVCLFSAQRVKLYQWEYFWADRRRFTKLMFTFGGGKYKNRYQYALSVEV